jgi:hypothetical protein
MLVSNASYFSRFFVKFVEIIAAGLATAVSGYLIAHLSGTLSSPALAPAGAVIQAAPSASTVSRSLPAQPTPPLSADVNEQRLTPQQGANAPPVAQPARRIVNAMKAVPPRKHMKTDTNAAESKRDQESVVTRVRAALANIDANRPGPPNMPPYQDNVPRGPAAIGTPPRAVDDPVGAAATAAARPGATNLQPPPVQQVLIEPNPLTAVEINSRPVAAVQAFPAPSATPPAQEETSVFSHLEQILRHDPLAATDEAPRPPMPVGQ